MNKYIIYTDGSLKGSYLTKEEKPQRGGWSAIICDQYSNVLKEVYGGCTGTTSPRAEILGVITGLQSLEEASEVTIISDSQYVVNTVNDGWLNLILTKDGFSNVDLWRILACLLHYHKVKFVWTKGHATNELNNRADKLAQFAARSLNLPTEDEYLNNSKESRESLVPESEAWGSNGADFGSENGEVVYSLG